MAMQFKKFKRNPGNEAFLYTRYSSDAQNDKSIEQQIEAAKEYAKEHKIKIVKTYEDRAKTGTTIENRRISDMLYEARLARPAYLLVWSLDRLSREIHDSFAIDGMLLEMGVQLVSITEYLPDDPGLRYAYQGMLASQAHSYILHLSDNVSRGLKSNADNAIYNGVSLLGYKGEPKQRYKIDRKTAPIVKIIYTDYVKGKPLQKIANELNARGYTTARGKPFVVNSLRKILTNRAYLGEYSWGKDENHVFIKDGMPRLIDDETFAAAQKRLADNSRGGKGARKKIKPEAKIADFWLTGHIFCGECAKRIEESGSEDDKNIKPDNTMQGTSGLSHTGKRYYYYSCKYHRKHKCDLKDIRKEVVEGYVNFLLNEILNEPTNRYYIAEACYEYYKRQDGPGDGFEDSLKDSISDIEKQLRNMTKAIADGIYNETTQEYMLNLEETKKSLEEELVREQERKKYILQFDTVLRFLDSFARDNIGKHLIFDIFIDKIFVFNDKIAVTFHYNDDRREMPISDILEMIDNNRRLMSFVRGHENEVFGFPAEEMPDDVPKEATNGSQGGLDFFG